MWHWPCGFNENFKRVNVRASTVASDNFICLFLPGMHQPEKNLPLQACKVESKARIWKFSSQILFFRHTLYIGRLGHWLFFQCNLWFPVSKGILWWNFMTANLVFFSRFSFLYFSFSRWDVSIRGSPSPTSSWNRFSGKSWRNKFEIWISNVKLRK